MEAIAIAKEGESIFNQAKRRNQRAFVAPQVEDNDLKVQIARLTQIVDQAVTARQQPCPLCHKSDPDHDTEHCPQRSINRNYTLGTRCYNCQSTEHRARDCPRNQQQSNQQNKGIKCYNCNQMGHISKNCDQPRREYNQNRNNYGGYNSNYNNQRSYNNQGYNNNNQNQNKDITCSICNKKGHHADNCRSAQCEYCKRLGHTKANCSLFLEKVEQYEKSKNQRKERTFTAQHEDNEQPNEMQQLSETLSESIRSAFQSLNLNA
jgi:cellular nucleic acid-binding protein